MAGHSKWANTKHRKAIQDCKRGKIFTKIIRDLVIATKLGGRDPRINSRLRAIIDKALLNNINRNTLNRAIARGMSSDHDITLETIIYEGYGPGGIAIMVECLSNNRNRTVAEVRHAFMKNNSNLGDYGSVSHLFTKKGIISYAPPVDEEMVMYAALESGADDLITYTDGSIDILTPWKILDIVKNKLYTIGLVSVLSKFFMIPAAKLKIDGEKTSKLIHLINMLEACNDVQVVYHNCDISIKNSTIFK
ncbi:putative transcriptional regulatory protein YebC [Candidatus Profftia lariciata]|uniref:YebC/PmpR family DNA-binding transcriptional regulator n=1 Tax=Candidatus Profftia lariciata TaxID=1987921 RepID=UPI001D026B8B|nr:YebC/PmpR family DNA-binding transcriptional regulator [Candidatus Profftia lariciata]UDG81675.1 putative transcriptional regulatory protein YebC [Candidatus Profftia lariciata]